MRIRISGGRVVDPGCPERIMDILIEDGKIIDILPSGSVNISKPDFMNIDAAGKIVTPGLIDMHVHLREPGDEDKETIETGCRAAVFGGFTAVCAMPNTNPTNDCPQVTEYILKQAGKARTARVHPVAAISRGLKGAELCNFADLKRAGAVAVSDDGRPVMNSRLMQRAFEHSKQCGLLVISHCEDLNLANDGLMNAGKLAEAMGLKGIPNASESIMVMRDITLSELTGSPLHIAHVSAKESVDAIREAKKKRIPVTAETAPHYFMLTENAVSDCHTNAKMNPPLRSKEDREAIRQGLSDGTIDVIATDHAPHTPMEKQTDFTLAPNGIIGLETSLPLSLSLVKSGLLTLGGLVEKMSTNPARILGLNNRLAVGNAADITVIDPDKTYTVDASRFRSRSRNTPFDGWEVTGKAVMTIVNGKISYRDKEF